jgi:hypothetical protein
LIEAELDMFVLICAFGYACCLGNSFAPMQWEQCNTLRVADFLVLNFGNFYSGRCLLKRPGKFFSHIPGAERQ